MPPNNNKKTSSPKKKSKRRKASINGRKKTRRLVQALAIGGHAYKEATANDLGEDGTANDLGEEYLLPIISLPKTPNLNFINKKRKSPVQISPSLSHCPAKKAKNWRRALNEKPDPISPSVSKRAQKHADKLPPELRVTFDQNAFQKDHGDNGEEFTVPSKSAAAYKSKAVNDVRNVLSKIGSLAKQAGYPLCLYDKTNCGHWCCAWHVERSTP
jgi:hypothetical protein